ncbi:MAG: dTMP kinase, partial [Nitrososphaerales archaeon]
MVERGKFIVFEGLDGAGLSTHSSLLKKWLLENKYRVHLSAEPTDSPIGSLIRSMLKNYWQIPKRPDILALLYAADRLYHVNFESYGQTGSVGGLQNALHEGYIVVYNRYILSSLAYQSVPSSGAEVDIDWLKKINNFTLRNGTPIPDMTIFLDVPPEECMKRITFERERYELFET